jgi:2-amino-4-hydroxy-6-hydroxymethyldihydropteridine diphosphokinase
MARASPHLYLIALGSNRRHHRLGTPRAVLQAALVELALVGADIIKVSRVIRSRPIGPSQRDYANAAVVIETMLEPDALLEALKQLERQFGRRKGQRWGSRVLDLDIILWSGGYWYSRKPQLLIPHRSFRERAFVLAPARDIAAGWRDPLTGRSIAQLLRQLNRPKRLDQRQSPP